jgi:hypothetical protein
MKPNRTHLTIAAALLLALALVPVGAAKKPKPHKPPPLPRLFAQADPKVPPPDAPGAEDEYRHSPMVYFTLNRGKPYATYRFALERHPRWNPKRDAGPGQHCGEDFIISDAQRATARGAAAWPLLPATFYAFHKDELCPGYYLGVLKEKARGRAFYTNRAVISFEYPSMDVVLHRWIPRS